RGAGACRLVVSLLPPWLRPAAAGKGGRRRLLLAELPCLTQGMRQLDRVDVMGFWPLPPQAWRLLVASALTIALTIAMASTVAADGPALRAVLIGNSYQAPQFAASLQNPGNDALAMEDLLVNRLGVAQAHVTVLQNADRAATYDAWDKA